MSIIKFSNTVVIFHKHKASHPYYQRGRANTLPQAVLESGNMISGRWMGEDDDSRSDLSQGSSYLLMYCPLYWKYAFQNSLVELEFLLF